MVHLAAGPAGSVYVREMEGRTNTHIASLHALRGIAALGVVALHVSEALPQLGIDRITTAVHDMFLAVDLFFVLSGVVMMAVYGELFGQRVRRVDYARFMSARVARIWPVLLLASVVALLIEMVARFVGTETPSGGGLVKSLIVEATGSSGWYDDVWLNPPSWSLSAELVLYLVAPLLIMAMGRVSARVAIAIAVIAPVLPGAVFPLVSGRLIDPAGITDLPFGLVLVGPEGQWFWAVKGPFILMRGLSMFLAGLALERLRRLGHLEIPAGGGAYVLLALGTLLAMHFDLPRMLVLWLLVALVAVSLGGSVARAPWLSGRTLRWLGNVSLGVYLLHWPLIELHRAVFALLTGGSIAETSPLEAFLLACSMVAFLLVLATAVHGQFEVPARRMVRRWSEKRLAAWAPIDAAPVDAAPGDVVPNDAAPVGGEVARGRWVLPVAILVCLATLPAGFLAQSWIAPRQSATQTVEITGAAWLEGERAVIRVHLRHAESLPVSVHGLDGTLALLGPHGRDTVLLAPGRPLDVLVDSDAKPLIRVELLTGFARHLVEVVGRNSP